MRAAQRGRLQHIEHVLWWRGWVRRKDIQDRYGVSSMQASIDLREFMKVNPDAVQYDRVAARYVACPTMKCVFSDPRMDDGLTLLESQPRPMETGPWIARVEPPARKTSAVVEQPLVRAVLGGMALEIKYASLNSSTFRWRWVEPHAFAHDGLRWHVRAFCREDLLFKDFVLGRISQTRKTEPARSKSSDDKEWATTVTLRVRLAHDLEDVQREALTLDYGAVKGEIRCKVRKALEVYALAQFGLLQGGKVMQRRFEL